MQDFLDRFFGITKRAYYLFAVFFTVLGIVTMINVYYDYFTGSSMRVWNDGINFICVLPIAWLLHRTAHWIVWGQD